LHAVIVTSSLAGMTAPGKPATRYQVVHGWPVVPDGEVMGWVVSGVGVDSRGDVFVLHRAGREWPDSGDLDLRAIPRATVLVFDGSTGALVSVESEARAGQTGRRGCATR